MTNWWNIGWDFKCGVLKKWLEKYKESVNILDDLSLENTEKILDELKNEKQQEKKFELFKSYNSEKIFFDCLDNLNDM